MLRVNMWGPTFERPTEDWTQIRHEDFDLNANGGRPQIFVDFGRGLRKIHPEAKIIGTVWSPPAWMKMSKSITDRRSAAIRAGGYGEHTNRVDPKYFKHFCKWMVEYVKRHDQAGRPLLRRQPRQRGAVHADVRELRLGRRGLRDHRGHAPRDAGRGGLQPRQDLRPGDDDQPLV